MPIRQQPVPVGTVVAIPVAEGSWLVGQVAVADHPGFATVVLFGTPVDELPSVIDCDRMSEHGEIAYFAPTFDTRIISGEWPTLGSCEVDLSVTPLPAFFVHLAGVPTVQNYRGTRFIDVTGNVEGDRALGHVTVHLPIGTIELQRPFTVSPALVEHLLSAEVGASPASDQNPGAHDLRVPPPAARSTTIFGAE